MKKTTKSFVLLGAISAALLLLSACGEKPQAQASGGRYQGKSDGKPWEAFGKDKQAWENQLKARAQSQNEYSRAE
jgi:hypothetical protein